MQRRKGGRIALIAETESGGKTVVLYNLHLESRNVSIRRAQLTEAIADARQYPPATRIIFGGDLNSVFHADRYQDELESAGYTSCFAEKAVRTHVVFGALDWIFVRGPLACREAGVIRGTKASDHDPVWAKISLINPKHPLSSM
jgi:endonuclease/exonuclease/phosphatase family metal-dependent hydrolase